MTLLAQRLNTRQDARGKQRSKSIELHHVIIVIEPYSQRLVEVASLGSLALQTLPFSSLSLVCTVVAVASHIFSGFSARSM